MMNMPPNSKKNSKSSSASASSINDDNNIRNMNKLKLSGHQAIGGGGGASSKTKSGGGVGRLFKGGSSKKTSKDKNECSSTIVPDSTAQVVVVEGDRRRRHSCTSSSSIDNNHDPGMSSIGSTSRSSTGTRSAGAAVIASYKQKDNKKTLANEAKIAKYISEERWDDIWQLIIKHGDTALHNKGTASVHVRYDGDDHSNGNILHMICHRALSSSGGNKKIVKRRGSLSTQDNEAKCLKVIKGLMNLFPLLDIQVNANKQTPLHVAVSLSGETSSIEFSQRIVSTLLKYGSSSPTLMQDCHGRTPLHLYLITHSSGLWNIETGQRNPSLTGEQNFVDVQVLRWLSEAGPKSITMEDANGQRPLNMIQELATLGDALEGNKVTGSIYRAMERTSKLGQVVNGPLNQPASGSTSRRGSMSTGGGSAGRTSCRSLELPSQGYTSIERLSPTSSLLQQVSSSIQGHNYYDSDQNGFSSTVSDGALVNVYRARKNAKVGFVDKIIHGGAAADVDQTSATTARRRSIERASRGKGDLAFAAAEASLQFKQPPGDGGDE